jgi:hypothetical protein
MEQQNGKCPHCGKEIPDRVLYRCVRCFTAYCMACDDSGAGKTCPKCGISSRMILDQGISDKKTAE